MALQKKKITFRKKKMGIGSLECGNLFWKQWKMVIVSLSDELYINCILCSRSARCLILGFFSFLNKWYVYLFIFGCAKSHLLCVHRPFSGCVKQQLLCSCNVWWLTRHLLIPNQLITLHGLTSFALSRLVHPQFPNLSPPLFLALHCVSPLLPFPLCFLSEYWGFHKLLILAPKKTSLSRQPYLSSSIQLWPAQ